jgi:hypothetical protein
MKQHMQKERKKEKKKEEQNAKQGGKKKGEKQGETSRMAAQQKGAGHRGVKISVTTYNHASPCACILP